MAADLYQPRNADELVQRFLRDVRLAAISEDQPEPPTGVGTDHWLTANGVAGMCILAFANIKAAEEDQNILTAIGDALERIRIAFGLPEVPPAAATGKLKIATVGATTIVNGQTFLYPNGVVGEVVGTYVNPVDGSEVNVRATVPGTKGNLKADQRVRFISPPINVTTEARVSQGTPLTGGTDGEDDERKRDRILNVLRNKPAGGNWGQLRQTALDALGSVLDCYVFPALGGPASVKIVPVKDMDPSENDFSRSLSASGLAVVRSAIQALLSAGIEAVIQASADEPVDVSVLLTIPESAQSGGNGQGWTDIAPWPSLEAGDAGKVTVTAPPTNPSVITVSALSPTAAVGGQTSIAWWSSADRKFRTALVLSTSGAAGARVLTLDRPLVDSTGAYPAAGDYICPAAQNLEGYGSTWIDIFRTFGTGENTDDSDRLPRARRHPYAASEDPSSITNAVLTQLVRKFPEITDYEFGYTSTTAPTVPSTTATAPNILIPRRLAFYPQ